MFDYITKKGNQLAVVELTSLIWNREPVKFQYVVLAEVKKAARPVLEPNLDTDKLVKYLEYGLEKQLLFWSWTYHVDVEMERNFRNKRKSLSSDKKRLYIFKGPLFFISSLS